MIKSLFSIFLFLLWGSVSAIAQGTKDTLTANSTFASDTLVANDTDAGILGDVINDSLYQPVADSLFSPVGQIREVPEKQVDRYKKSPDYVYANDPQYWRKEPPQRPGLLYQLVFSRTLGWILLTIIAALVVYGIYQLAKENHFSFLIKKRDPGVTGPDESSAEDHMDFEEAIDRNQAEGNYRMAIRFLYLRLIHILREKGGFVFRDSSTNAEIACALGKHPQARNFRWLATAYEYTYYGGFQPNRELYETLKTEFDNFQKKLSD